MKKTIIAIVGAYMFFMFLVYSGIFRNNSNPLDVTKYYFESLRNHEGFLTYQICDPKYFNEDRYGVIYKKYKMNLIDKIKVDLISADDRNSYVQAKMIYKDGGIIDIVAELEKKDKVWLMRGIKP